MTKYVDNPAIGVLMTDIWTNELMDRWTGVTEKLFVKEFE